MKMGNCVWGKDAVVIIKNVKCLRGWGIIGNFAGEYERNGIEDFFRKY